jgi:hypothetical protein
LRSKKKFCDLGSHFEAHETVLLIFFLVYASKKYCLPRLGSQKQLYSKAVFLQFYIIYSYFFLIESNDVELAIVIGGGFDGANILTSVEVYSPDGKCNFKLPDLPTPCYGMYRVPHKVSGLRAKKQLFN